MEELEFRKESTIFCPLNKKNSEGNRAVGRPRLRWVGNIKMNLREIG
jgi:hypothetical protein